MIGYTIAMARAIEERAKQDKKNPVFKLAKLAVKKDISMVELADKLDVTRSAVYYWFEGRHQPSKRKLEKIEALIKEIEMQGKAVEA